MVWCMMRQSMMGLHRQWLQWGIGAVGLVAVVELVASGQTVSDKLPLEWANTTEGHKHKSRAVGHAYRRHYFWHTNCINFSRIGMDQRKGAFWCNSLTYSSCNCTAVLLLGSSNNSNRFDATQHWCFCITKSPLWSLPYFGG